MVSRLFHLILGKKKHIMAGLGCLWPTLTVPLNGANGAQVTTQLLPQPAAALAVAQVRGPHHAEGQRGQGAAKELEEDIDETCLNNGEADPMTDPCMQYMVAWIPSIYPLYVSIYTSTMDPMGMGVVGLEESNRIWILRCYKNYNILI